MPKADPPRLERVAAVPGGMISIADGEPRAHWVLSNGREWRVALSQNNAEVPPEIHVAESGVIFVALYHGTTAALSPSDGRVISRGELPAGNLVTWRDLSDFVIADGEMAVAVFRSTGSFLWKTVMGDVIESIELKGQTLRIIDAAGHAAHRDILSGRDLPTREELERRIRRDIEHFNGKLPERNAIAWNGYLAGLIEWGLISASDEGKLLKLLPKIEDNPAMPILLGRPDEDE